MNGWSEQAGGPHAASPVLRPAACRARLDGVDTGARCDSGLPSRLARQRVSPQRSAAARTREHGAPGSTATSASGRNPRVEVPSRGSPRPAARHSKPDSSVLKRPSRNIGPAGSGIENGGPANSMHCPIAGNRRAGQKIAVQSSERRGPSLTRFEFNAQCHCAISVKYENNGDARHGCRANLRSRPRTEALLAIPLPPPLRQASKLREPAWQAVEERLFGENSGISFMPAPVRRDSIAARMRKLSRKCRLHGFAVHVRWLFPPPGWPIRTDKWRYHALSARRRFSGIAVEHALAARIECETARRKRRGDTRHAPPKVSVFGSQGEAIRDWVSSFGEIARLPRQNRKRRYKWMRRRETFGSIRQVRIDGRSARHPPERIGFIAESTHNPLRREIAGPP
ncbi:Uncharacterised protein [Burkholderia pseudomallei]|uniref:hypothetical protein n=1 Tax=Burkholderia pseudomallei TaxID=28450 RepID=UPI0005E480ED|nr:hypothetical protein [Burkholderia pseudomallei]MBF3699097.1 hypothetical protein [Burkholderia pseudomallei]MBF3756878.1 hypothetical protein [Burkholderia pseudomallei]MBY7653462.1 hypothetical protein [Burkholderia pseudomallei]MDY7781924.1 hypothetical protein [Burkholderia pseudomallei]MDY7810730.1 hypothetical protein [Burkholderia pseudomallei]